jgi:DNA-binding GntR family transcriptional regulator
MPRDSSVPPRATAQQLALNHLRRRIADGSLGPDARIRQERIAEEIGASVVPVREALKILEAEGQVLYVPHRGYQVRRLGVVELVETYRLRELLEDEAVRLASNQLGREAFAVLDELMITMEVASAAGDLREMTEANRAFHFLIFELAGMPRLTGFIRQLWQSTDAYRARYYGDVAHRNRVNDEHRRIVQALRAGRTEDVILLHREHRSAAVQSLKSVIELQP